MIIKEIVDENPNLYLDKIAFLFGTRTQRFLHYSRIRKCIVCKLEYSMKVLQTVANQQCENDE